MSKYNEKRAKPHEQLVEKLVDYFNKKGIKAKAYSKRSANQDQIDGDMYIIYHDKPLNIEVKSSGWLSYKSATRFSGYAYIIKLGNSWENIYLIKKEAIKNKMISSIDKLEPANSSAEIVEVYKKRKEALLRHKNGKEEIRDLGKRFKESDFTEGKDMISLDDFVQRIHS